MPAVRLRSRVVLFGILTVVIIVTLVVKHGLFDCTTSSDEELKYLDLRQEMQFNQNSLQEWQQALERKEADLHHRELNILRKEKLLPLATDAKSPIIYCITPTHTRPVQKAELTRISQTFLHVKRLHWIVVEDAPSKTGLVATFLKKSGLVYTHLNIQTPPDVKMTQTDPNWLKPRGTLQRNLALSWIRDHFDPTTQKGVLYFADDDNTYDLRLFEQMRSTQTVSVWPVGLVGGLPYEAPICRHDRVVGWFTYWKPNRPFALDMAGFAVNVQLLFEHPSAKFDVYVQRGYQETSFLSKVTTLDDLEPKSCSTILVWHTRTEKPNLKNVPRMAKVNKTIDPHIEV